MLQNGNIVFSDVVKELLKAFRGKRSQLALSRRLQYTFNQGGKREAGHTKIRWDEFVRLCKICKAPLDSSLRIHYKYQGSPQNCAAIIKMIIESHNVSEVSKKTGLSRHSLASWIKSKSFPTLQENILEKPSDIEGNFQLREYWWGQALQHLKERPFWATLTFAFQMIAVSETAFRKIRALSVPRLSVVLPEERGC